MNDFHKLSATQLAELIATGESSSRKIVTHFIERVKKVNPQLNAVVVKLFDEALIKADKADEAIKLGKTIGRLHGVPITIKECLDLVGTPSTFGLLRRKKDFPESNDAHVEALKKKEQS